MTKQRKRHRYYLLLLLLVVVALVALASLDESVLLGILITALVLGAAVLVTELRKMNYLYDAGFEANIDGDPLLECRGDDRIVDGSFDNVPPETEEERRANASGARVNWLMALEGLPASVVRLEIEWALHALANRVPTELRQPCVDARKALQRALGEDDAAEVTEEIDVTDFDDWNATDTSPSGELGAAWTETLEEIKERGGTPPDVVLGGEG